MQIVVQCIVHACGLWFTPNALVAAHLCTARFSHGSRRCSSVSKQQWQNCKIFTIACLCFIIKFNLALFWMVVKVWNSVTHSYVNIFVYPLNCSVSTFSAIFRSGIHILLCSYNKPRNNGEREKWQANKLFNLGEAVTKTTDGGLDDTVHARSHDQI